MEQAAKAAAVFSSAATADRSANDSRSAKHGESNAITTSSNTSEKRWQNNFYLPVKQKISGNRHRMAKKGF